MKCRRISYLFAIVVVLSVFLSASVFATDLTGGDAAAISKTMRAYQALYRYLYTSGLKNAGSSSYKYVPWSSHGCGNTSAPAFPPNDFYEYKIQDEDNAVALVKEIAHLFTGSSYQGRYKIYHLFVLPAYWDLEGESVSAGSINFTSNHLSDITDAKIEANYRVALDDLYSLIVDDLKALKVSGNYTSKRTKYSSDNYPSCSCQNAKTEAENNWPGSWSNYYNTLAIGQSETTSSSYHSNIDPANNPFDESKNYYTSYSANIRSTDAKINADLRKYSGTATCYIKIQPAGVHGSTAWPAFLQYRHHDLYLGNHQPQAQQANRQSPAGQRSSHRQK